MDGKGVLGFEYDLRDVDRAAFLNEARETFDALASGSELGDMSGTGKGESPEPRRSFGECLKSDFFQRTIQPSSSLCKYREKSKK